MLCNNPQKLLDLVRSEARGAETVLSADDPVGQFVGFCVWSPERSVTHSVHISKLGVWEPACPDLKRLFLLAKGRMNMAKAMKEGRPLHEDCPACLADHVMNA